MLGCSSHPHHTTLYVLSPYASSSDHRTAHLHRVLMMPMQPVRLKVIIRVLDGALQTPYYSTRVELLALKHQWAHIFPLFCHFYCRLYRSGISISCNRAGALGVLRPHPAQWLQLTLTIVPVIPDMQYNRRISRTFKQLRIIATMCATRVAVAFRG